MVKLTSSPDDLTTLVERYRAGDKAVITSIMEVINLDRVIFKWSHSFQGTALAPHLDEAGCREAAEDGLLRALSHVDVEHADISHYLRRSMSNGLKNLVRKVSARECFSLDEMKDNGKKEMTSVGDSLAIIPGEKMEATEEQILAVVESILPPKQFETIRALFKEENYADIAESQNIPLSTLRTHIHRIRQRLQEIPYLQRLNEERVESDSTDRFDGFTRY